MTVFTGRPCAGCHQPTRGRALDGQGLCPDCREWVTSPSAYSTHLVHESLIGEWCSLCGDHAAHKIGEELTPATVHNLTNYLCCKHFRAAVGSCDDYPLPLASAEQYKETS